MHCPQRIVLAIIPSMHGYSGDVVNETQLLSSVCKKIDLCYVFTILSPIQAIKLRKARPKTPENMRIVTFLTPPRPTPLLSLLSRIFFSYIFALIVLISGFSHKLSLIYIREPSLATAFLSIKSLARKTVVKMPTILEEEMFCKGLAKRLADSIVELTDRLAFAKAKKVAVHSIYQAMELMKRRRYKPEGDLIEIRPGVSLSAIMRISNSHQVPRTNDIRIGYVGTLYYRQGVDLLAKAVAIVKNKFPNVRLVIVGDGSLKKEVLKICQEEDVKCEFTGFIKHEKALQKMRELDILVLPSRKHPVTEAIIAIKVVEAWALGVPVIVTHHKAYEAEYRDLEDLVYCNPEPKDIACKILLLLEDKNLREKLRQRGPELAKKYDYDMSAEKLLA
ncbi:MAG: glycosyltransferase family 4 protein [Thermoproteota archaeon]